MPQNKGGATHAALIQAPPGAHYEADTQAAPIGAPGICGRKLNLADSDEPQNLQL